MKENIPLPSGGADASGDETPKLSHEFTVDQTPPETTATFTKNYQGNFPVITLVAEDPALADGTTPPEPVQYEYRFGEEGDWVPFTNSGTTWLPGRPLSFYLGYIAHVRAIDAAGNIDPTPASVNLMIYNRTNPISYGVRYCDCTVVSVTPCLSGPVAAERGHHHPRWVQPVHIRFDSSTSSILQF